MTQTIAIVGAKGFVGQALCDAVEQQNQFDLIRIHRGDDIGSLLHSADIVIHTANPAKRFFAKKNPEVDFLESVEKTHHIKNLAAGKKFVLVSSISARSQLDTVYGRNRRACELIADPEQSLIVRLGPMFGAGKMIGALHDLLNDRTVFVSETTQYGYVDVQYNAHTVLKQLDRTGIVEVGARNGVPLGELKQKLGSASVFEGTDDTQVPINPPEDAPDAWEVLSYVNANRTD